MDDGGAIKAFRSLTERYLGIADLFSVLRQDEAARLRTRRDMSQGK